MAVDGKEMKFYIIVVAKYTGLSFGQDGLVAWAYADRGREVAFLVAAGLDDEEVVRLSIGLYALFRVVNAIRFGRNAPASLNLPQLFRLYAKKALNTRTRDVSQASLPSPT